MSDSLYNGPDTNNIAIPEIPITRINITKLITKMYVKGRLQELTEHCKLLKNLSW